MAIYNDTYKGRACTEYIAYEKKTQINLIVKNLGQCFSCHMKFGGPTLLSKVAIVGNKHNRMI